MSSFFLTFDTETSRVISYQSSVDSEADLRGMIQAHNPTWDISPVEEDDALTAYMIQVDGVWQQRQKHELIAAWSAESVAADGASEIVLSPLPIPCTVYLDNDVVVVEDGSLEFATEAVGFYRVMVNEPAYLLKEWTINAV